MATIQVTYTVAFQEDSEGNEEKRNQQLIQHIGDQVKALRMFYDTNLEILPAVAISSIDGEHNL